MLHLLLALPRFVLGLAVLLAPFVIARMIQRSALRRFGWKHPIQLLPMGLGVAGWAMTAMLAGDRFPLDARLIYWGSYESWMILFWLASSQKAGKGPHIKS